MRDYSGIAQVRISESEAETNELLAKEWMLMDVGMQEDGRPLFVLGLPYMFDLGELELYGSSTGGAVS